MNMYIEWTREHNDHDSTRSSLVSSGSDQDLSIGGAGSLKRWDSRSSLSSLGSSVWLGDENTPKIVSIH